MRLQAAQAGDVVQNERNKSYYRFERPEGDRTRIRPLELFPNGLLIPKSQDTIVDSDLMVRPVGRWRDDLVVSGKPSQSEVKYAAEMCSAEARLMLLQEQYDLLPSNGTGTQSRGSHANKIKAVQTRIANIKRGLGEVLPMPVGVLAADVVEIEARVEVSHVYVPKSLVQLASGLPALVVKQSGKLLAVRTKCRGTLVQAVVPAETVRPWAFARLGTA